MEAIPSPEVAAVVTEGRHEDEVRQLRTEVERLRAALGALVEGNPYYHGYTGVDACLYCEYMEGHADDCPWAAAKALLET